jgi:predicted acyl esterase
MSEAKLVTPGVVEKYEFSGFTFFSRQLAKGSRLRLLIASPNSRMLEKNYNSGGVVAEESGKDGKTAHVMLYHDAQRASYLELPIGK